MRLSYLANTKARPAANAADPLGFDMKVGTDLDPSGRSATGLELVADALLHRLQQGKLLMIEAPDGQIDFGVDVRTWIGEALSQEALSARGPIVEEVLRRDVRIADVTVKISKTSGADAARRAFRIDLRAQTVSGETLDRIVGVDQVTVEFLAAGR